ncbi:MAG: lipoyl(octanoyl) transferase LipB [Sphingomonadales bacterium]|jgi:lipoyl(octanoyl) transferase
MAIEWIKTQGGVSYEQAIRMMEQRVADIIEGRADEAVWLLEHPPLYTSGTGARPQDLINTDNFPVFDAGRGGQYTYHGPGQRVAYVMLDLRKRGKDIRKFIATLENVIIDTLAVFGVKGERREGRVGVWVQNPDGSEDKIAAIGVRVRRWVSFHGISINIDPDLSHYDGIIPCGIRDHGVTSLKKLGIPVDTTQVDEIFQDIFEQNFPS